MNPASAAAPHSTGAIPGDFAVASDGAALYTVALALPPGTGGLAPSLALVYNSAAGNDLLGMGWRLSGLSSIRRIGAIPAVDGFRGGVAYGASDRFSLDGQRLVNLAGTYGAADAIYHTELESWRRIVPVHGASAGRHGPDAFIVHEKNGHVLEFGGTPDARVTADATNASVRCWLVNRITDRHGNFITFQYHAEAGAARIARIDYTGNGEIAPRRSVRFSYQARPDPSTHYVAGFAVCSTQRMSAIDTFVDEQRVTRYQLDYLDAGATGRSRLGCITQIDAAGNSLTPTRLQWQDGGRHLFAETATQSATGLPFGGNFLPVDVNGDGRIDFVNAYRQGDELALDLYVALAGGAGFDAPQHVPAPGLPWGGQFFPMDVNGDGHTDLVYAWRDDDALRLAVFLAAPDAGQRWSLRLAAPGSADIGLPWGGQLHAIDIDGDGATDFVYLQRSDEGSDFTIVKSNHTGFERGQTLRTKLPYGGLCLGFDLNGDGIGDIAYAYHVEQKLRIATLISDGQVLSLRDSALLAASKLAFSGALLPMDFNGDGLVDLVHASQNPAGKLVLTPIVSTGAGLLPQAAQTFDDIPFNALLLPGDLNGDGIADLAIAVQTPAGTTLHALLSTGAGFRAAPVNQPLRSTPSGALFPIDLDGVGRNGLLSLRGIDGKLTLGSVLPSGAAPDLLTDISTGSGAVFALQYRAMTDAQVYRHDGTGISPNGLQAGGGTAIGATFTPSAHTLLPGSTGAVAPLMTAAFPKYVLASYARCDGRGNAYEYRYVYDNAAIDIVNGRGWLGFARQSAHDADVGTTTMTAFHQEFPLAGMLRDSSVARSRDGACMHHTALRYEVLHASDVLTNNVLTNNAPHAAHRTYLPLVTEVSTQLFTFGHLDATQRSATTHDAWGNPVLSCEFGDGSGAPLFTHRTFVNDSAAWRIGFKSAEKRSADRDGAFVLALEKTEFSPRTMNVVSQSVWHDQGNCWLEFRAAHDRFGNIVSETDHAGASKATLYETGFHTFVVSATTPPNADGLVLGSRYEYEPCFGELLHVIDSNHVRTRQQIDGFGRLVAKFGPGPAGDEVELLRIEWGSDDYGAYQESRERFDWEGRRWNRRREYLDGFERVHRTVSFAADGVSAVTVDKRYSSRNLITHETLPSMPGDSVAAISRSFDECDRVLRVERPAGDGAPRVDLFDYPDIYTLQLTAGAGSSSERRSSTVQASYNGKQLPVAICDGTGGLTAIGYDALGRTIRTEDAAGNVTVLAYDTLDNKISASVSNGGVVTRHETARYDMPRREVSRNDARGCTSVMRLDALGRPLWSVENGERSATYRYDDADAPYGLGRLAGVVLPGGAAYAFAHDANGDQSSIIVTLGGEEYPFQRTFLPSSRPASIVYPDGATHHMCYTAGGMLESLHAAGRDGKREASIGFAGYNAAGKPSSLRHGNGFTETLAYNVSQQLRSQRIDDAAGGAVLHTVFKWSAVDDLVAIDDLLEPASSYAFSYDRAGRLLEADGPYRQPQRFRYDAAGNLTLKDNTALVYRNGLLAGAGELAFGYDAMGNTTGISEHGGKRMLDYDAAGKLASADGCTFTYDHQGRRLGKRQPDGCITWYVLHDYEVVVRPDGARQHTRSLRTPFGLAATVTLTDRAAGAGADAVAVAGDGAGAVIETGIPVPGVCYFHRNQVNSTTIVSDEHGAVLSHIEYLPFGDISRIRGMQNFRAKYAGRELDHETGLYDFGARYYLPRIGRFITADDGFGGPLDRHDSLNSYAYVLNSPVCNVDPTGHSIFDNMKQWMPYVVSGLLIVAGVAVLATTPFGGVGSVLLAGMLLGAGIGGMVHAVMNRDQNFSWNSWGIQLGIGGAVGLASGGLSLGAGSAANALFAGGRTAFALGAVGRVALQVGAGVIEGAAGSAFSAWLTNIDNGLPAAQGVGWAALVGGVAAGIGAGVASKLAGTARFSRLPGESELLGSQTRLGAFNPLRHGRVAVSSGILAKAALKAPVMLFGTGGKALIKFGPQSSW